MTNDLLATILWLGTPPAITALIAILLANWTWFADLGTTNPLLQQGIEFLISAGMSVGSMVAATYIPSDTIKTLEPYWIAILTAINVVFMKGAQGAHLWWSGLVLKRENHNADLQLLLIEKRAALKARATPPDSSRAARVNPRPPLPEGQA